MKSIVGKLEGGGSLEIDVPVLLRTRMLIQANSGGGKSFATRRVIEQTAKHVQQIILDVEDEFFSLREKFDFLICAPSGADAVANPTTAALLARRLRESRVSAIIGLYELNPADRRSFVRLFLEELVEAPKSMWHPAIVVIDEAHHFCPEKGEAESMHAVIDIASRGRKRGLCSIMATQRLSKLHKDTAAELLNKLSGRVGLDIDTKRAADDLGMPHREAISTLRNLEPGEFFAYGPALSKTVVKVVVGAVVTHHPDVGDKQVLAPPPPSAKIKKLLAELADLPTQAAQEIRTLAEFKTENARLKRELSVAQRGAEKQVSKSPPAKITRIEVPVVGKRAMVGLKQSEKELRKALAKIKSIHEAWASNLDLIGGRLDKLTGSLQRLENTKQDVAGPAKVEIVVPRPHVYRSPGFRDSVPPVGGSVTGPQQKILNALAWFESAGIDEPLNVAVAFVAGYSHKGSAYTSPRSSLRAAGLIEYRGNKLVLLDGARSMLHHEPKPLTQQDLHEKVMQVIPGPEKRILRVLLDRYPLGMTDVELAEKSGYSVAGSAFTSPKSRLRSLGLLTYPSPRAVRASDFLFQVAP